MNPGAVLASEHEMVLLAKGYLQHWLFADHANYMRGSPIVFSLDPSLRKNAVAGICRFDRLPAAEDIEAEDFRLFTFAGEVWVNHYLIEVTRTEQETGYRGSRVCLSRLDAAKRKLTFLGQPRIDFDERPREKNWVFVEARGELYLLYSFCPYVVLKLVDRPSLAFSSVISHANDIDFEALGGFECPVSYSTNPIRYDDGHFLVLVHQSSPTPEGRSYHHWGVLLDKTSLSPKLMTSRPLMSGEGARGLLPGVLYVSSVVKIGDDFVFFNGEGDTYVTSTTISKADIDKLWSSIPVRQSGACSLPDRNGEPVGTWDLHST